MKSAWWRWAAIGRRRKWLAILCGLALTGCSGPQSALDTAGAGAEAVAHLFWWMTVGAGVIWVLVMVIAVVVSRRRETPPHPQAGRRLILIGGVIFPVTALTILLTYGLSLMPRLQAADADWRIDVIGERWWWRVHYHAPNGDTVISANEIRLPAGQRVEFRLTSPEVIHSFWIPALGGKLDMVPGRENRLVLEPTEPGVYRGQCAEFCGSAHTWMAFDVVVMPPADFAQWLEREAKPARAPDSALAARGRDHFLANGCGGCHAVRGTAASGTIGPDLTHVGARRTLGAGTLPNTVDDYMHWIARTDTIKPGVLMPAYGMLPEAELRAIAAYLDGLQ